MTTSPTLVKLGGSLAADGDSLAALGGALAEASEGGARLVVVHGGGAEISQRLAWLNEAPRFLDGLRVTSPQAMEIVEMTLSGLVNKRLVRLINGFCSPSPRAVGISGVDGGLLRCEPHPAALGRVGVVKDADTRILDCLLRGGYLPVVSPVSADAGQKAYNVNADAAAAALAAGLGARRLLYFSDVRGVRDEEGRILPRLDEARARAMIAEGAIRGGMIPKVLSGLEVLRGGVGEVHICAFGGREHFLHRLRGEDGEGTVIAP